MTEYVVMFAVSEKAVGPSSVCVLLILSELSREELRKKVGEDFNKKFVWFEDEVGSSKDPILGPHPQLGTKALIERN